MGSPCGRIGERGLGLLVRQKRRVIAGHHDRASPPISAPHSTSASSCRRSGGATFAIPPCASTVRRQVRGTADTSPRSPNIPKHARREQRRARHRDVTCAMWISARAARASADTIAIATDSMTGGRDTNSVGRSRAAKYRTSWSFSAWTTHTRPVRATLLNDSRISFSSVAHRPELPRAIGRRRNREQLESDRTRARPSRPYALRPPRPHPSTARS